MTLHRFPAHTPGIGPAMRALSDPKSSREVRTAATDLVLRSPMAVDIGNGAILYAGDGTKQFLTAKGFTDWLAEKPPRWTLPPQFHADNPPFTDRQITFFIFGCGAAFWGLLWLIGVAVDAAHKAGWM